MQVWREWTAMEPMPTIRDEQRQQHGVLFGEWELARLSFVRWLCQTGRLHP